MGTKTILVVSDNYLQKEIQLLLLGVKETYHCIYMEEFFYDEKISPNVIIFYKRTEKIEEMMKVFPSCTYLLISEQVDKRILSICDNKQVDYVKLPSTSEEIELRIQKQLHKSMLEREYKKVKNKSQVLLNNIPYMAWIKDTNGNYTEINDEFMRQCGKREEEIYGHNDVEVWSGTMGDKCSETDYEVIKQKKKIICDEFIINDSEYRHLSVYKSTILDDDGEVTGTVGIGKDITELKNIDTKFQILMNHIPFDVWFKDLDGVYVNINESIAKKYNRKPEDVIGKKDTTLFSKEEIETIYWQDKQVLEQQKHLIFEEVEIRNGEEKVYEIHKNPVIDISGKCIGIVGLSRDITDIKKAEQQIRKHAYTDSLTKLANRRGLYHYLRRKIKETHLHILFIDLDDFKKVNDTCGHHRGDEVLKNIANLLSKVCEDSFIARVGGDEFITVLEGSYDKKRLESCGRRIIRAIEELVKEHSYAHSISASVGIVSCSSKDEDIDQLLIKGDMALYQAKENGKNQYVFYTKGLENERLLKINIERDLHYALENNEVEMHYQPVYTNEGVLKGFESLFRWNNPKYKKVPVIKIINLMEKSAYMDDIGNSIIEQAFRFAKEINENRKEKDKLIVTVNLSAVQIMRDDFISRIKGMIDYVEVCPTMIGIEITETVLLENIEQNIRKLHALKELGITILLDDFGTGYSSFNYLVQLPLSYIKIDKSFINGMDKGVKYKQLIKLVIEAAHTLKMNVVAEGVETKDQLNTLKEMNVDCVQGYYYAKPLQKQQALQLLN